MRNEWVGKGSAWFAPAPLLKRSNSRPLGACWLLLLLLWEINIVPPGEGQDAQSKPAGQDELTKYGPVLWQRETEDDQKQRPAALKLAKEKSKESETRAFVGQGD